MTKWITVEECLAGREIAVKRERERIIKLLENHHNFDQIFLDAVDQVIALIKGENK
jgi:hypothetical protein